MYCRLKWEMETGLVAPFQNSHMSEHKQERDGGAGKQQRHPQYAQVRGRSDAVASSEKSGELVKRSRRKE